MRPELLILFGITVACGSRKNVTAEDEPPKDLKTQIEDRTVELTCNCINETGKEYSRSEFEAVRDACFQNNFQTIMTEFNLTLENMPYSGPVELLAAQSRVKDGVDESCWKKKK